MNPEVLKEAAMYEFLTTNAAAIQSGAAILGVIVAAIGFWIAIVQLYQTQRALKAANTYAIQRDARELQEAVTGDDRFLAYVKTGDALEADIPGYRMAIARLLQFYLSVYRQKKSKGISKELAHSMGDDFARFFRGRAVRDFYDGKLKEGVYGDEHKEMAEKWAGHSS